MRIIISALFSVLLISSSLLCAEESLVKSITHEGLKLELQLRSANELELRFVGKTALSEPTIFAVQNPARIVLDLQERPFLKNGQHEIQALTPLKGVRFGVHKDKVRIVLDLVGLEVPPFKLRHQDGISVLSLLTLGNQELDLKSTTIEPNPSPANSLSAKTEKIESPSATPIPTLKAAVLELKEPQPKESEANPASNNNISPSSSTLKATTLENIKPKPTIEPPVSSAQDTAEVFDVRKLSTIKFTYLPEDRAPVIVFTLSARPDYSLARLSEKSFKLLIPKSAVLNTKLLNPFFPPRDFKGFNLVQVDPHSNNDLEIIIGVEKGVKLTSAIKGDEIIVRAINTVKATPAQTKGPKTTKAKPSK